MYLVQSPLLFRKASRFGPVWQMPGDSKTIYLTFDDGPVADVTPEILNILDSFGIKATFFCVGENITKNPDIFKMILEKGHTTGNHTFNHLNGWKTHSNKYIENIHKCDQFHETNLFRPPYGRIKPSQILKLKKKYKIIMWSVLSGDFDLKTSPEKCFENVLHYTKPGSIIVFHDSIKARKKVIYTLPLFLKHFLDQGYSFKTL
jgi:peptidoglycan-N-acetylglucosamine deacetylase